MRVSVGYESIRDWDVINKTARYRVTRGHAAVSRAMLFLRQKSFTPSMKSQEMSEATYRPTNQVHLQCKADFSSNSQTMNLENVSHPHKVNVIYIQSVK
jgi:hypothetical protein